MTVCSGEAPGNSVEIHGPARQEIASAVLNNYPLKLHISKKFGPVVLVDAGNDEEELLETLGKMQELKAPVRRDENFQDLLRNPTLERLKAFVAVKKLLEGR